MVNLFSKDEETFSYKPRSDLINKNQDEKLQAAKKLIDNDIVKISRVLVSFEFCRTPQEVETKKTKYKSTLENILSSSELSSFINDLPEATQLTLFRPLTECLQQLIKNAQHRAEEKIRQLQGFNLLPSEQIEVLRLEVIKQYQETELSENQAQANLHKELYAYWLTDEI